MVSLVGKIAKRYTFSLQDHISREYVYLVSFVDVLLPDMEDYKSNLTDVTPKLHRVEKIDSKNYDKVYLSIDYFLITQDFLEHPEKNFEIKSTSIKFHHQIRKKINTPISLDLFNAQIGLRDVLPKHCCLTYLDFWQDEMQEIEEKYGKDEAILEQLSNLSKDHLNFDISLTSNVLGNLYILHYNTFVKNVHVKYNENPEGMYLKIQFRPNKCTELHYFACNKQSDDVVYEHQLGKIEKNEKYYFIPLKNIAEKISLYVWDENDDMVFLSENKSFIMKVSLNMSVNAFNVRLDNGKKYEKFETTTLAIPNNSEKGEMFSISNDKTLYEEKEKSLDFIFFDGSDKKNNILRAKSVIGKILDSARDWLYICDPYFDLNVLETFVLDVKNVKVHINILMEKTWKDLIDAKKILSTIKDYNSIEQVSSISCRVLRGECSLHDRYIVADDVVWLLGTSLNNIGEKVSTIVKIPMYARKDIISRVRDLLNDNQSDSLENRIKYIESLKKNR